MQFTLITKEQPQKIPRSAELGVFTGTQCKSDTMVKDPSPTAREEIACCMVHFAGMQTQAFLLDKRVYGGAI